MPCICRTGGGETKNCDITRDRGVGEYLPRFPAVQGDTPDGGMPTEKCGDVIGTDVLQVMVHAPRLEPAGSHYIPKGYVTADKEYGIVPGRNALLVQEGEIEKVPHHLPELVPGICVIPPLLKGGPAWETAKYKNPRGIPYKRHESRFAWFFHGHARPDSTAIPIKLPVGIQKQKGGSRAIGIERPRFSRKIGLVDISGGS